jgi:hypothetical protein
VHKFCDFFTFGQLDDFKHKLGHFLAKIECVVTMYGGASCIRIALTIKVEIFSTIFPRPSIL